MPKDYYSTAQKVMSTPNDRLPANPVRNERRADSTKQRTKFGIPKLNRASSGPRANGTMATGQDGVKRKYDAATKTWRIVK